MTRLCTAWPTAWMTSWRRAGRAASQCRRRQQVRAPGRRFSCVGLENLLAEIGKVELLRSLALPLALLCGVHPKQIKRFRRRTGIETAWERRRIWNEFVYRCLPSGVSRAKPK
jgi:hypothetical protein